MHPARTPQLHALTTTGALNTQGPRDRPLPAEPEEGKRRKLAVVRDILIELGARTAGQLDAKLIGV